MRAAEVLPRRCSALSQQTAHLLGTTFLGLVHVMDTVVWRVVEFRVFSLEGMGEVVTREFSFSSFLLPFLFLSTPTYVEGSQARGRIGAVAAGLHHSNTRSEQRL